jgi:hypothetical protein
MQNLLVTPHPLKVEIKKLHLQLWKIRKALGGSPSEAVLSRALSGIVPMPEELESKIRDIVSEYQQPIVTCK